MDPDFLRELIVLAVTVGLYVFGSILIMRGHHTDLSPVHPMAGRGPSSEPAVTPRLNRRRKAMARDAERRRGLDDAE